MKTFIYLITIILSLIVLSCQKKDEKTINNISFNYTSSYKKTHIEIGRTVDNQDAYVSVYSETFEESSIDVDNSKWRKTKDTVFHININSFNKLTRIIASLEKIDAEKAFLRKQDGDLSFYRIEYGANGKNQVYVFLNPYYDTKKRGLNEFMNVTYEIFKTVNLKKEDVLETNNKASL